MVRARLFISGIVQGVGYRYHCRRQAQSLGLAGWVRNIEDGRAIVRAAIRDALARAHAL